MSNNLVFGIRVDTSGVTQALNQVQNQFPQLGTAATRAQAVLSKIALPVALVSAVTAATVVVYKLADATAQLADDLGESAEKLGLSAEYYQKFKSMADKSGVSVEVLATSMKKLSVAAYEGDSTFEKLGVAVKGANGQFKSQEELFKDTLIALSKLEPGVERTTMATKLLGKGAGDLNTVINQGADAIKKQTDGMSNAVIMSDRLISASSDLKDAQQDNAEAWTKLRNEALTPIIEGLIEVEKSFLTFANSPGVKKTIEKVTEISQLFADVTKGFAINSYEESVKKVEANEKLISQYRAEQARYSEMYAKYNDPGTLATVHEFAKKTAALEKSTSDLKAKNQTEYDRLYGASVETKKKDTEDQTQAEIDAAKKVADAKAKAHAEYLAKVKSMNEAAYRIIDDTDKDLLGQTLRGRLALISFERDEKIKAIRDSFIAESEKVQGIKDLNKLAEIDKQDLIEQNLAKVKAIQERNHQEQLQRDKALWDSYTNAAKDAADAAKGIMSGVVTGITGGFTGSSYARKASGLLPGKQSELEGLQNELTRLQDSLAKAESEKNKMLNGAVDDSPSGGVLSTDLNAEAEKELIFAKIIQQDKIDTAKKAIEDLRAAINSGNDKIIGDQLRLNDALEGQSLWGRIFKVTDEDEENLNRGIEMVGITLSTAMNMFSAISDAKYQARMKDAEADKAAALESLKDKKITDKARIAEEKRINEQFEKDKRAAFEKTKGLKIAQVGMDAASAIMGAWSGAMQLPFPASVIAGGSLTTMLGITAGIQANNIRKQEYAGGGVIGGFNGASMGPDNRQATIREGEMIFNARQQRNLFKAIDSGDVSGKGISINIERFTGGDDELSKLEDMLYNLQSNGRFKFA